MTETQANYSTAVTKYETEHGEVALSPQIIKSYLVSGDADRVTAQEVMMFLSLCKYQRLNPFLREAYLIKYGGSPATIVTGKDVFTKRAAANPICTGWEAGIIVKAGANIEYRKGTFIAPDEVLLGGWAKVHRKDWGVPLETTVSLSEYERRTSDGKLQRNWQTMPATMIRKVALVQALREAMPADFQGLYSPEEMPVDVSQLPTEPVKVVPQSPVVNAPQPITPAPPAPPAPPVVEASDNISKPQAKRMFALAEGQTAIVRAVLSEYGYEHSEQVKRNEYEAVCNKIVAKVAASKPQAGDDEAPF